MRSDLCGCGRSAPFLQPKFQASQESNQTLAARDEIDPNTVWKCRNRTTTAAAPMGLKTPKNTLSAPAERALVIAFGYKTLLSLNNLLECMRDTNPNFCLSALDSCLRRHSESLSSRRSSSHTVSGVSLVQSHELRTGLPAKLGVVHGRGDFAHTPCRLD